jgi:hypothetical protein
MKRCHHCDTIHQNASCLKAANVGSMAVDRLARRTRGFLGRIADWSGFSAEAGARVRTVRPPVVLMIRYFESGGQSL